MSNHQTLRTLLGQMIKDGDIKAYVLAMNCGDGQIVMANTKDKDKNHFHGLQTGVKEMIQGWDNQ